MSSLKQLILVGIGAVVMAGALGEAAEARVGVGWGGFSGGAPPYYFGRPNYGYPYGAYFGYPYYGYYGGGFEGCFMRRRVVGHTQHERPIVKRVHVCY